MLELFGTAAGLIRAYADLLSGVGIERGLLGPREAGRLWRRHLLNCVAIAPVFEVGATICDVGSGAGLPGLVIALARPDLTVTLVEPLLRRATFLHEAVDLLGLQRVDVVRGRAEDGAAGRLFDAVTARAVAPLGTLVSWCLPLVRPGGELIALKGSTAASELHAAAPALRRLGAGESTIETFGAGFVRPPTTVCRIRSGSGTSR